MAYFSNSEENEYYKSKYCDKCVHGQDEENECPIMFLHWIHNYSECNKKDSFLNYLIPREKGDNGKCATYKPLSEVTYVADKVALTKWVEWASQ